MKKLFIALFAVIAISATVTDASATHACKRSPRGHAYGCGPHG
jgi:hypothetical protein